MRIFFTLIFGLLLAAPMAQAEEDSTFASYDEYSAFVDDKIKSRDFAPLILRLGGGNEYPPEEMAENNKKLLEAWPIDFTNSTIFRHEDFGGGVMQEGRLYWTGTKYAFFHALLHQHEGKLTVVSFYLNNKSKPVMERF